MEDLFDFKCCPLTAWITVNRACNLRCIWCYGQDTHFDSCDNMPLSLAKDLVSLSKDMGVSHISLIGGEPTLWNGLFELISKCKELNLATSLITNAVRFADDVFWNQYINNPCDSVSISVKSTNRSEFNDITGSKKYDEMISGVKRAIKFHKCGVTTVYNKLVGINGLKRIAYDCRDMGANYITVDLCTSVLSGGDVIPGESVEPMNMARDIMDIYSYLDDLYDGNFEVETYIPLCLFPKVFIEKAIAEGKIATMCQIYSRNGLNFNTNGDIIVCNQLFDYVVAECGTDFMVSDSLMLFEYLNSKALCDDYAQILRYPSRQCSNCYWNKICRGGCLVNWTQFNPSICKAIL